MSGNSNQEADALFATKRKKQQEEQAEQDRQAEIMRKKVEMEAEINRLAEETERQRIVQEEAKQAALHAEDEAKKATQGVAERAAKMADKASKMTDKETPSAIKEKLASKESGIPVKLMAIIGGAAAGIILLIVILVAALSSGGNSKIFKPKFTESIRVAESNFTVNYPSAYFAEDNHDGSVSFEYGKPGDEDYVCIIVEGMSSAYYQEMTGQSDMDAACRNILSSVMSNFSPTYETYSFVSGDGYTGYSSSFMTGDVLDAGYEMPMAGMILNADDMCYFAIYTTAIEGAEEDLEDLAAAILSNINK